MATLQATTSSTWSRVKPNAKERIEKIADDYNFWGAHEEINIDVKENSESDTIISIHGYASFDPSKPIHDGNGECVDEEYGYAEEFLERIAPHLEEPLVVETIGHEKCRFPLIAGQWTVWPDGTVQYDSFDHQPDKPATDGETELLTVAIESETVRIETAAGREVAMWTREELAESSEAFSAAFEAVRQAADAPEELLERQRAHLDAQSKDDASEQ